MSETPETPETTSSHGHGSLVGLTLGALGIVFGDIGTSPLYTVQECFATGHGVAASNPENVLGILSLFFWSLMLVVSLKYVAILMRADNRGEGGIMALLALVPKEQRQVVGTRVGWVTLLVLAGAALLFGDGVITPAISVLSAIEGLKQLSGNLAPAVVPITVAILLALFSIQSRGTGKLGKLFGPIMVVWFLTIGLLGLRHLLSNPGVLWAISPTYAFHFFVNHGFHGFALLGSVVLCVTGGEALYADMGHFGRAPIQIAWTALVLPSLICCYFGQGALLLNHPEAATAPFFSLVSSPSARVLLILLATAATVIASQGLISAVFSLTHQAVRLGYFPRVMVRHTSSEMEGQIYVPAINWSLAAGCLGLVLMFRESTKLAAAFGLAVSGTMAITSVVLYSVTRNTWKWPAWKCLALLGLFLSFDIPFFLATCIKFADGGYIPFVIGILVFGVMVIWTQGRSLLRDHYQKRQVSTAKFHQILEENPPTRLPGLSVYLASQPEVAPPLLLTQLQRFRGISEQILLLSVVVESRPFVAAAERFRVEVLAEDYFLVVANFGFSEIPEVLPVLRQAAKQLPLRFPIQDATYFVGRETFLASDRGQMTALPEKIFAILAKNSTDITLVFNLPPSQVIELGTRLDL